MKHSERFLTKTSYRLVKQLCPRSKITIERINNPENHRKISGQINHCKTIHERDEQYFKALINQEYGHLEGDEIIENNR